MAQMDSVDRMIDLNAYQSAIELLEEMLESTEFGMEWGANIGFGRVSVQMMLGYVHALNSEYDIAIDYYEQALASPWLTNALDSVARRTRQAAIYTLANLVVQKQDYERAIELLQEWFEGEDDPFAEAFMLMGTCYAALEQFEEALPYMEEALARSDRPIESWYRNTLSVQLELEKHAAAIANLKVMLQHWTDRPYYWETLARLHANNGDIKQAFDTLMSAHAHGMIDTWSRARPLVELSVNNGVPHAGATVLNELLDSGIVEEDRQKLDLLIDTWTYAREYDRAIEAIERIANYVDPGPYYLQAARLYLQSAEWRRAADSAERALDSGIDNRALALTIAGMASLELRDYEGSLDAFRQVLDVGSARERENAQNWIDFVEEARDNRELLSATQ